MKLIFTLLVAGLLVFISACKQNAQKITESDIANIREVVSTYQKAGLARDWNAWQKTIAADAIFCPPNHEPLVGREAIVAWVRTFPPLLDFTESVIEVSGYKDMAYGYGQYAFTAKISDTASFSDNGSHLDIFRKEPDGSWVYIRHIFHSDKPIVK